MLAIVPLGDIGPGGLATADDLIGRAEAMLASDPWVEACDVLDIVRVIRLHADGAETTRAAEYRRLQGTVEDAVAGTVVKNAVWLAHAALAAKWAGELSEATGCVRLLTTTSAPQTRWTEGVGHWLQGLIDEKLGRDQSALAHYWSAATDRAVDLPLYRGHMLVDHARLARVLGDGTAAERSLSEASTIYGGLGAATYLQQVELARLAPISAEPASGAALLTDREQDVLTLVAAGLSYAQIARELFVTQSTVGYHLSNIYRKAGVTSRHQLTELVRHDPRAFGLATL